MRRMKFVQYAAFGIAVSQGRSRGSAGFPCTGGLLLGLAVLSTLVLGPLGLISYAAGLVNSVFILVPLLVLGLIFWLSLLVGGCIYFAEALLTHRRKLAIAWFGLITGILLSIAFQLLGVTPSPMVAFAHGVVESVELRTDISGIQAWVSSVDMNSFGAEPVDTYNPRRIAREDQPEVLRRQNGSVILELDADGRLRVRLDWGGGLIGHWGLVIGHETMETPPSEQTMFGEMRIEIRPGVYFWQRE